MQQGNEAFNSSEKFKWPLNLLIFQQKLLLFLVWFCGFVLFCFGFFSQMRRTGCGKLKWKLSDQCCGSDVAMFFNHFQKLAFNVKMYFKNCILWVLYPASTYFIMDLIMKAQAHVFYRKRTANTVNMHYWHKSTSNDKGSVKNSQHLSFLLYSFWPSAYFFTSKGKKKWN